MRKFVVIIWIAWGMGRLAAQTPIEIWTAEDMAAIVDDRKSAEKSYVLMNDLTLDAWTPISFNGSFNGNGHTITLAMDVKQQAAKVKSMTLFQTVGLFNTIGLEGLVMNLHLAGQIEVEGNYVIIAVGGIAGINYGTIANCRSSARLKATGVKQTRGRIMLTASPGNSTTESVKPFDGGTLAGGIVGLNAGKIQNCTADGDIEIAGNGHKMGGGIAGGNGNDYIARITTNFNAQAGGISGGLSLSSVQNVTGSIDHCYATSAVYVHDDDGSRIAGGVVGRNIARIADCVALNRSIEASGASKRSGIFSGMRNLTAVNAFIGDNFSHKNLCEGASENGYYCSDIPIDVVHGKEDLQLGASDGTGVDPILTQDPDWWEGAVRFAFGKYNTSPWVWDDELQRPVLYWEVFEAEAIPLSKFDTKTVRKAEKQIEKQAQAEATSGELAPGITWDAAGDTIFINGTGKMLATQPVTAERWKSASAVAVSDGITEIGHHSFAMSKLATVVLGKDVSYLGAYAFFNCNQLTRLELKCSTPPKVGNFVFLSTPIKRATLAVPAGAKPAYEKDKTWKKFGTIEESGD
jgi:hypothetical protein